MTSGDQRKFRRMRDPVGVLVRNVAMVVRMLGIQRNNGSGDRWERNSCMAL